MPELKRFFFYFVIACGVIGTGCALYALLSGRLFV